MRPPVNAYVAIGANLGEAQAAVLQAMDDIGRISGVTLERRSSLYRTAPLASSGPDYVNAVVQITTSLSATALLQALQDLEQSAGRQRPYRNAPRTLDLDLLTYGDATMDSPQLTLPHPRMSERAFVLLPLHEIAPHRVSPAQLKLVQGQFIERI